MKLQISACDRCGNFENGIKVISWSARKGSQRYTGDLCETCWKDLMDIFKPSTLSKGRHQIVVHSIDDIPKNA